MKKFFFYIAFCFCITLCFIKIAQAQSKTVINTKSDSLNLATTKKIKGLLEEQNINKAVNFFRFKSKQDSIITHKQLITLSKQIQPIKKNTNSTVFISFRNYKDSFNLNQVIYHKDGDRFCLFELFYLKNEVASFVVDIFIKDTDLLTKERKANMLFRKKNPGTPLAPVTNPPGIYIKEQN